MNVLKNNNRYIIGISLVLLFLSDVLYAKDKMFTVGYESGINRVSLSGSTVMPNLRSRISWYNSVNCTYDLDNHFSVTSRFAYEQKGAKTLPFLLELDSFGTSAGLVNACINLNYLTLPILARYSFGKQIKYYGGAGVYMGYLVNHRDVAKGENTKPIVLYEGDAFFKRLDFGFSVEIGLSYLLSKKVLVSGNINSSVGLVNIYKRTAIDGVSIRTQTVHLALGIAYRI